MSAAISLHSRRTLQDCCKVPVWMSSLHIVKSLMCVNVFKLFDMPLRRAYLPSTKRCCLVLTRSVLVISPYLTTVPHNAIVPTTLCLLLRNTGDSLGSTCLPIFCKCNCRSASASCQELLSLTLLATREGSAPLWSPR